MSITPLLRPNHDYLDRLTLWRIQLDQHQPAVTLSGAQVEGVLYGLMGTVGMYVDGQYHGSCGARERMSEEIAQAARFRGSAEITLTLTRHTYAADMLWITCRDTRTHEFPALYRHQDDARWHTVGEGTHLRRVAEIPTPPGALIACGETHNLPGGWSSWPPHATQDDIARFTNGETTWEEVFFCVCSAPGVANLQGVYTGNIGVHKYQEICNGHAYVVPLGSHAICAGPGASMIYVWAYTSGERAALQKQYNQAADDLGTYRK